MFISGRILSAFSRQVLYSKAAALARWRNFCNDEEVYWCEKLHVKLWLQAPEVMVHLFPFISFISLLAGFSFTQKDAASVGDGSHERIEFRSAEENRSAA